MATYYSIDDGHGNQITTGLQDLRRARKIAQRHSNESGLTTLLYSSDDEINEVVRPKSVKKIASLPQHATAKAPYYHVYAPDGFESAHRSLAAAERAAKLGAKNRRMEYRVYVTSSTGMTGSGHGTLVYTASPPRRY